MKTKLLYADNILTCSNFNRNFILNHFSNVGADLGEKIRVHQHGLNFADLPFRLSQRVPSTIIAVGRFVKQKGFDVLLHAMQILRTRGISVQLQLVGDGTEARFLRSLVSQLNISDAVNFSGWLPADEVPNAIAKAALLVHPSPDIGDGVPNVIKEAMAVGTPVVATRVAGIPELLDNGKCGMIIPPRDAKALAQAIERVLTNGSLGCEYAIKARQRAEAKFDLWRNGVRLAKILRSLRQFDEDCIEALPGDRPQ